MEAHYFRIILEPDPEQGGFWVEVPALPGCYTQGDTIEEAVKNAEDVIALYRADLIESGEPTAEDEAQPHALFVKVTPADQAA